jgi:hypothetical protein
MRSGSSNRSVALKAAPVELLRRMGTAAIGFWSSALAVDVEVRDGSGAEAVAMDGTIRVYNRLRQRVYSCVEGDGYRWMPWPFVSTNQRDEDSRPKQLMIRRD